MAINTKNVRDAFAYIRKNNIKPNRDSTKWDIIDPQTQQRFPPKAVLRVAYDLAGEQQPHGGGGWPTNDPLKRLGFQIVLKLGREESAEAADIRTIFESESDETTRLRLISARLGQGAFRKALLEIWKGRCAVTGCQIEQVLRASHVKPWRDSTNYERLDPHNGVLLAASIDALFDGYLVSFSNEGKMLIDPSIKHVDLVQLGIPEYRTINFSSDTKIYLEFHRRKFNR